MKPFIPGLKTEFILAKNWEFTLVEEHRNDSLAEALKVKGYKTNKYFDTGEEHTVSLSVGVVVCIERIHIRAGHITLSLRDSLNGKKPQFWVKLSDFNAAPLKLVEGD